MYCCGTYRSDFQEPVNHPDHLVAPQHSNGLSAFQDLWILSRATRCKALPPGASTTRACTTSGRDDRAEGMPNLLNALYRYAYIYRLQIVFDGVPDDS